MLRCIKMCKSDDKPGYVWSDHLSSPDVATRLKRPTRKPAGNRMLSVRSCFGWGLHSLLCYQTSGSLLHCLFTLTLAGGYFLLHFPGSHLHRTLSGILPYEARTFLTCVKHTAAIICPAQTMPNYFTTFFEFVKCFFERADHYYNSRYSSLDAHSQNRTFRASLLCNFVLFMNGRPLRPADLSNLHASMRFIQI